MKEKRSIVLFLLLITLILFYENCNQLSSLKNDDASNSVINPISTSKTFGSNISENDPIVITAVHVIRDLYVSGCDIWKPYSATCRQVSNQLCQDYGYVGGLGIIDWTLNNASNIMYIACFRETAAELKTFSFNDSCQSTQPISLQCHSYARRQCSDQGYSGSTGVVYSSDSGVSTLCFKNNIQELSTSLSNLEAYSGAFNIESCSNELLANGQGCLQEASLYCQSQGYTASLGITEYNGNSGDVTFSCVSAPIDMGDFIYSSGVPGYAKKAVIGRNYIGGPAFVKILDGFNGLMTYGDGLRNDFDYPIIIRRIDHFSTESTSNPHADQCYFLNECTIQQVEGNYNGELHCSFTNTGEDPRTDFGEKGILLKPGEIFIFQGTTGGTSPQGLYSYAELEVSKVATGLTPMRRIRFPRYDSGYQVNSYSLSVSAGCNGDNQCNSSSIINPDSDAAPHADTNWYWQTSADTTIRGVSIFNGLPKSMTLDVCIKVMDSHLAATLNQYCFQMSGDGGNPNIFTSTFNNNKNSFADLNLNVSAGNYIGVDYSFTSTSMIDYFDFGAYVWIEDRDSIVTSGEAPEPTSTPNPSANQTSGSSTLSSGDSSSSSTLCYFFPTLCLTTDTSTPTPTTTTTTTSSSANAIKTFSSFTVNTEQRLTVDSTKTLVMQGDGNFVLYDSGSALWSANETSSLDGQPVAGRNCSGCYAIFQSDGNLVLYDASGTAYWASGTPGNENAQLVIYDSSPYLKILSSSGNQLFPTSTSASSGDSCNTFFALFYPWLCTN